MGKKISIAIIDNGINQKAFYEVTGKHIDSYYASDKNFTQITEEIHSINHGTFCSAIVAEFAPNTKFINIAVFDEKGNSSIDRFRTALNWCCANNIDVISMSTGFTNWFEVKDIEYEIKKLYNMGIVIVAACSNRNIITYPASLPEVLGVKYCDCSKLKEGEYIFVPNSKDGIDIKSSMPKLECMNKFKLNYGVGLGVSNSLVTPYIAGLISNIIVEKNEKINIEDIRNMLITNPLAKNHTCLSASDYDENKKIGIPIVTIVCDNEYKSEISNFSKLLLDCFQTEEYSTALLSFDTKTDFYANTFQIKRGDIQKQLLYFHEKLILDIIFVLVSSKNFSKEIDNISDLVLVNSKIDCCLNLDEEKVITINGLGKNDYLLDEIYDKIITKFAEEG